MCEVDCVYKNVCTSYKKKCHRCKHNKGKRDHFEPDPPCYPWYPYYPYYPYTWPYTWWTTNTDGGTTTWTTINTVATGDYFAQI